MKLPDYDKILNDETKTLNSAKQSEIAALKADYESKKAETENEYKGERESAEKSFEDDYRINAVERFINQREIEESMANNGLSNSGLNKTKQSAVSNSYFNKKARLDTEKQTAIKKLTNEMNSYLEKIKNSFDGERSSLESQYTKKTVSNAQNRYKTELNAYNKEQKQANDYKIKQAKLLKEELEKKEKDSYIIKSNGDLLSRDFTGSLKDNGVNVIYSQGTTTYRDTKSGKKTTLNSSVNPYTGNDNRIENTDTAQSWKKYGCYSNGYQPRGVIYKGVDHGKLSPSGITDVINGNRQTVHKSVDGMLWIWDGKQNKYLKYI